MNTKQKIYDLKAQQKALLEKMKGMEPAGEEYVQCEKDFDSMQSKVEALEKQLQREEKLGVDDEDDPDHMKGFDPRGADPTEKVFQGTGVLKGLKLDSIKTFAADVRKSMTEGTGTDGGYTVPEDIVNRVYSLIEEKDNILPYITNTHVTTKSGKRTYKTRKQLKGFKTVSETAAIPAQEQPSFAQLAYNIAKRAGILPVSVELMEDSDENITALVINWLADEARVTINSKVIALATSGSPKAIKTLDDLLHILTVGLGSSLRAISTVHTNDNGLFWLLTQKDSTGRSLLQADPTDPKRIVLCIGAVTVPVKAWDNDTMGNTEDDEIPFVIGSLSEGIERFDRKQLTITKLTEATVNGINLAEQDMVAFKGSMRDDYQLRDKDAFVYAVVSAAAPSAPTGAESDAAG